MIAATDCDPSCQACNAFGGNGCTDCKAWQLLVYTSSVSQTAGECVNGTVCPFNTLDTAQTTPSGLHICAGAALMLVGVMSTRADDAAADCDESCSGCVVAFAADGCSDCAAGELLLLTHNTYGTCDSRDGSTCPLPTTFFEYNTTLGAVACGGTLSRPLAHGL